MRKLSWFGVFFVAAFLIGCSGGETAPDNSQAPQVTPVEGAATTDGAAPAEPGTTQGKEDLPAAMKDANAPGNEMPAGTEGN